MYINQLNYCQHVNENITPSSYCSVYSRYYATESAESVSTHSNNSRQAKKKWVTYGAILIPRVCNTWRWPFEVETYSVNKINLA
jgi:hypothetical protein